MKPTRDTNANTEKSKKNEITIRTIGNIHIMNIKVAQCF